MEDTAQQKHDKEYGLGNLNSLAVRVARIEEKLFSGNGDMSLVAKIAVLNLKIETISHDVKTLIQEQSSSRSQTGAVVKEGIMLLAVAIISALVASSMTFIIKAQMASQMTDSSVQAAPVGQSNQGR